MREEKPISEEDEQGKGKSQVRLNSSFGLIHPRELWSINHAMWLSSPWDRFVFPNITQSLAMGSEGVKFTNASPFS